MATVKKVEYNKLRMILRESLLSILKLEYELASVGTTDNDTAYIDVAYEMLYAFDSLVTGSTIEYTSEKHDAIIGLADYVYRYTKTK